MIKWKIPAIFAGVGALISLIAGIAGGNPFGLILLRMIFSLVAAGGVGFAVLYVLRRYLPELAGRSAAETSPAVDIVIEDELPLGGFDREAAASEEAPAGAEPQPLEQPLPEAGLELEAPFEPESLSETAAEPLPEVAGGGESVPLETLPEADETVFSQGSLDSLADIDGTAPSTPARGSGTLRGELSEAQVDSLIKGQDPASLAKAVRTFLNKDREG
jgi:hypothetical protein